MTTIETGRARLALGVLCAAQFMLIVDMVVLTVALPTIQDDLRIPTGQLQLAGIAYTLTFGSLLIVAGRAGDLFGRRRIFQVGLAIFTVASALVALSQTGWQLFATRALQGVGAAMVSATALALVTSMFAEGERRNRALGLWGAIGSGGAIAGQLLGGVLTDAFGWQSIFLINVPIGVAASLLAARLLPESRGERLRLDLGGAVLLTAGVATFSVALTDRDLLWFAGVSVVLLFWFWRYEKRHEAPLVRFALLRERSVRSGNLVMIVVAGTSGAALFFTTLYLQKMLDYSAMQVGLAFAPINVIILVVSPYAGGWSARVGARALMVTGTVVSAAGVAHLSFVDASGSYLVDVLPGLATLALGNGLTFAPTMITATSVPPADAGFAAGLLNTSQELGAAVGLAVLAPVAAAVTGIDGYRSGYLAAAGLLVLAVVAASRAPGRLAR